MDESYRIACGLRPRTLKGWIFWWRYWSPYARAWYWLERKWYGIG